MTLDGVTKKIHVVGQEPAVIVMAEMPGISPHVARFARWVEMLASPRLRDPGEGGRAMTVCDPLTRDCLNVSETRYNSGYWGSAEMARWRWAGLDRCLWGLLACE
jgi:hypothetical protein